MSEPSGYMPLINPAAVCRQRKKGETRMREMSTPWERSCVPAAVACSQPRAVMGGSHMRLSTHEGLASSHRSPCRITNSFCVRDFFVVGACCKPTPSAIDAVSMADPAPKSKLVWHTRRLLRRSLNPFGPALLSLFPSSSQSHNPDPRLCPAANSRNALQQIATNTT